MMKKMTSTLLALILAVSLSVGVSAAQPVGGHVTVTGYDAGVDYMYEITRCLDDGGPYAMAMGGIYEKMRNMKIQQSGASQSQTDYFVRFSTAQEIKAAMAEDNKPKPKYTEAEIDLVTRVVYCEAGDDRIPDWVAVATASVILNRVNSGIYPSDITSMLYQPSQYGCVGSGAIWMVSPTQRIKDLVRDVLTKGSQIPSDVLAQSGEIWGPIYRVYYGGDGLSTIYFCHM